VGPSVAMDSPEGRLATDTFLHSIGLD
jgi:hypothetical protein